ncbi:MAG: hypothetical protein PHN64_03590 [Desulfovibrionaceae bacterium]|nr:hypothetical protein [Desulfovibrionaceae bacterium]
MTYPIIDIRSELLDFYEQLGTKSKFWYDNEKKLFKQGRPNTGENWAEVVASRICDLLQLPHAHYDFAIFDKKTEGVVCETIVPDGGRLIHANELLAKFILDVYLQKKYQQTEYTLRSVLAYFINQRSDLYPPINFNTTEKICSALSVFIGYLLLDTLIANQDRHHENWGIINKQNILYLAPTYDHASSLGRELSDEVCYERLHTKDRHRTIGFYANKGCSAFRDHEHPYKRLSTLEAFKRSASKDIDAAKEWLQRLSVINEDSLSEIYDILNGLISEYSKQFSIKLVLENKKRLLCSEGIL